MIYSMSNEYLQNGHFYSKEELQNGHYSLHKVDIKWTLFIVESNYRMDIIHSIAQIQNGHYSQNGVPLEWILFIVLNY